MSNARVLFFESNFFSDALLPNHGVESFVRCFSLILSFAALNIGYHMKMPADEGRFFTTIK